MERYPGEMEKRRIRKTKLKRAALLLLCAVMILSESVFIFTPRSPNVFESNGLRYVSKTEGRDFYLYAGGRWQKTFLTGVNIGASKPGHFPGELAITKEDYLRWFHYIQDMNATVIRVYTTLPPGFYEALYEFNRTSPRPLYLMQGVWVNEQDIARLNDAFAENGKIRDDLIADALNLVDIIHGRAILPERAGFASGRDERDISPYVIGWILGIEWDPHFVQGTNLNNPARGRYAGKYLQTDQASPFEAFLCEVGDRVIDYEIGKYRMARALSFTNWLTTDMLSHPNEPFEQEDMSVVNTEHIKATGNFIPGLFASYHVYPYYPEFVNYQKEYASFRDETGRINTYKAYLRDLFKEHSVPVLVAEFGVPSSRGKAHEKANTPATIRGRRMRRIRESSMSACLGIFMRRATAEPLSSAGRTSGSSVPGTPWILTCRIKGPTGPTPRQTSRSLACWPSIPAM